MIYSKDSNVTLFVASQEENPELINSLNLSLDNNEKKEISIEDMSIENFDLMDLENKKQANKKRKYIKKENEMKKVLKHETKKKKKIVKKVKKQINCKSLNTISNVSQTNLIEQLDYSNKACGD